MTGLKEFINGQDDKELKKIRQTAMVAGDSFEELANTIVETTAELSGKTISTIKKYPLHTALAIGVAGFIAGALITRKN